MCAVYNHQASRETVKSNAFLAIHQSQTTIQRCGGGIIL